jgi:hypothetical protein
MILACYLDFAPDSDGHDLTYFSHSNRPHRARFIARVRVMLRIAPVTSVSHPPATPAERGSRPAGVCFARGRIRNCAQGCSFAGQREPASAQRHVGVIVKRSSWISLRSSGYAWRTRISALKFEIPKATQADCSVQDLKRENKCLLFFRKLCSPSPFRAGMRGVSRSSRTWCGLRRTRMCLLTSGTDADGETCGPDAPTLASSRRRCSAHRAGDGGKRALVHRGARISRKTTAQGRPV